MHVKTMVTAENIVIFISSSRRFSSIFFYSAQEWLGKNDDNYFFFRAQDGKLMFFTMTNGIFFITLCHESNLPNV